jgi:hypothetical protein
MKVKTDYQKGEVTITDSELRSRPLCCEVLDSQYNAGALRLSVGRVESVYFNRKTATELLPILQRYIDTGSVVEGEYRVVRGISGFSVCDTHGRQVIDRFYHSNQMAEEICDALNRVNEGENK